VGGRLQLRACQCQHPRDLEIGYLYQIIEKDALFAQWIDSDFAGGSTDGGGSALRAAWQMSRNVRFNLTYMFERHQPRRGGGGHGADGAQPVQPRLPQVAGGLQLDVLTAGLHEFWMTVAAATRGGDRIRGPRGYPSSTGLAAA
jgi:hypothetical protein